MAVRVIDGQVKQILQTTIDTTPFIQMANVFIGEAFSGTSLSEAYLTQLEKLLAAHFACMMDPRTTEEFADKAKAKFEGKHGMGLEFTRYGQQAMLFDTSGVLKTINSAEQAGSIIVPTRTEE